MRRGGNNTAIDQGPSHSLKETNMQLFGKTTLPADIPADIPADQATMSGFVAS